MRWIVKQVNETYENHCEGRASNSFADREVFASELHHGFVGIPRLSVLHLIVRNSEKRRLHLDKKLDFWAISNRVLNLARTRRRLDYSTLLLIWDLLSSLLISVAVHRDIDDDDGGGDDDDDGDDGGCRQCHRHRSWECLRNQLNQRRSENFPLSPQRDKKASS